MPACIVQFYYIGGDARMQPVPIRCVYCKTRTHAFIPPQYDGYIGHCPKCNKKLNLIEKIEVNKTNNPLKDIAEYRKKKEQLIKKSQNLALHGKISKIHQPTEIWFAIDNHKQLLGTGSTRISAICQAMNRVGANKVVIALVLGTQRLAKTWIKSGKPAQFSWVYTTENKADLVSVDIDPEEN